MESDYTALASRVAARAEVLGCLILSRDGLVLGAFPPHGEGDITPAWLRFSGVGEPQRGFITFRDELWAYAAHGDYAAFAVALSTARAGIILDLLEQALMEADQARGRHDAVRPPETVNLTAPPEQPAPPPSAVPSYQGVSEAAPEAAAVPAGVGASQEGAESASSRGQNPEDVDRVALAREFAQLLQENPFGAEEGR
jgi:hypothetical protein